jgi:threonyl-tRNA synthetase
MEAAQKAVDSVADGVKKVVIGEKKPKVKKEKGGDGGADEGPLELQPQP